ncbi:unnamed protein product [Nippostrongylus brasiliensis]|uniref:Breast carcinoma amplified sequence 1 n=1 Tax=Nippostrongylus brasiliensis TaxID=27835 RepID=A0A0N4XUH9_NIPBR|nr:unnamed protein product [Nippostrongylus brasiliensis]
MVTAELYCQQLCRVELALRRQGVETSPINVLHHNASPHTARSTREKLQKLGWQDLLHAPYSPDLAPSDYRLHFGRCSLHRLIRDSGTSLKCGCDCRVLSVTGAASFIRMGFVSCVGGGRSSFTKYCPCSHRLALFFWTYVNNEQEYTHFEEVDAPFRPAIAEILPTAPCMQKKQKSPEECPVESGEKLNKEKMIKEENKIDQTRKDLYKTAVEEDDEKADDPKKPTSDKKDESSKNTSSDKTADKEVLPGMVESQTFLNPHEKNLAGKENKTKATALRPAAKSASRRKLAALGKLSRLSDRKRKEPQKVGAVESQSNLNVGEKKVDDDLGKSPNITESESKTKVSEGAEASKPALVAPTRRKSLIGGFGKFSYASDKRKDTVKSTAAQDQIKNETCEKKGDDDLGKSPNLIASESKTKVSEGAEASKPATRRKSLIGGFGKFSGIAKSDAAKPSAADSASKVSTDTTKSSGGTQEAALKSSAIGEKSTKVSNSEKKKKTKRSFFLARSERSVAIRKQSETPPAGQEKSPGASTPVSQENPRATKALKKADSPKRQPK